ncbi:MAG: hypothetical protein UHO11_09725 [Treponema sp.]|nr:hypothetical protein [Treponema sp.]
MEKIIGGEDFYPAFPVKIRQKILWPCYEFIALANGVDDYEKNILDEVVLRLADINITDIKEIALCTGLEEDLISFIQSRLEQRECIDDCCRITEVGKNKLGELSENKSKEIHVYVDAVSGRIIPYYCMVNSDNCFKYSYGKEEAGDSGAVFFRYKGYSTAGTETDEMQSAYKLHYGENFNKVPDGDDVTEMLHKLHPGKDGIYATVDENQGTKKNLRWILLEVFQPEGSSRDWIFTNGFGKISPFFSVRQILDESDRKFISELRNKTQVQTNDSEKSLSKIDQKYPNLSEKNSLAKKSIGELNMTVDSPDKEESYISAISDALLYLTQLAEWTIFHILHNSDNEYAARKTLSDFEEFKDNKGSDFIIGRIAEKCSKQLGFDFDADIKKVLNRRYGKLWYAFNKNPSLFPLVDILVIALKNEKWFKDFAKTHSDFLTVLSDLSKNRNHTFHSGDVADSAKIKSLVETAYRQIVDIMRTGLGIEITTSDSLTFSEKLAVQNQRDSAITRMEQDLGFTLCKTLDENFIRFVTDMERRGTVAENLDHAIILDEYKIFEHIFVSVTECLGSELRNSDWQAKVKSCGITFSSSKEFQALLGTDEKKIASALEGNSSSMNAACIAFLTLADTKLLRKIAAKWKDILSDVSYVASKRAHGEIPASIDAVRALEIKQRIIELIHFFAENGF